jgi:hypothetical protein
MGESVETDAKVTNQMRLSNPLLLLSLGVVLAAASCTLITDVDRSKIPDGLAGAPGAGGDSPTGGTTAVPQAGEGGLGGGGSSAGGSGGAGNNAGGAGAGGMPEAGAGGMPEGGSGGAPEGGAGAAGPMAGGAGAGN